MGRLGKEGSPAKPKAILPSWRAWWQTIRPRFLTKEKIVADRVNRFNSIARDLALEIDAFARLGLREKGEQDLFVDRFAVHLYGAIVPRIDPFFLEKYFNAHLIDSVLGETDTVKQRLYKRGLDHAARFIMKKIVQDLQTTGEGRHFAQQIYRRHTGAGAENQPLFVPTPEGQQSLEEAFEKWQKELMPMKVELPGVNLSQP